MYKVAQGYNHFNSIFAEKKGVLLNLPEGTQINCEDIESHMNYLTVLINTASHKLRKNKNVFRIFLDISGTSRKLKYFQWAIK